MTDNRYDINLFTPDKNIKKADRSKIMPLIISGIVVVVMGVALFLAMLYFNAQSAALDTEIAAYNARIQAALNNQSAEQISARRALLQQYNQACDLYIKHLQSGYKPTSKHFYIFDELAKDLVQINGFTYQNGTLTAQCRAFDKQNPSAYAGLLDKSREFSQVIYEGYFATTDNKTTAYDFTVSVLLKVNN